MGVGLGGGLSRGSICAPQANFFEFGNEFEPGSLSWGSDLGGVLLEVDF